MCFGERERVSFIANVIKLSMKRWKDGDGKISQKGEACKRQYVYSRTAAAAAVVAAAITSHRNFYWIHMRYAISTF